MFGNKKIWQVTIKCGTEQKGTLKALPGMINNNNNTLRYSFSLISNKRPWACCYFCLTTMSSGQESKNKTKDVVNNKMQVQWFSLNNDLYVWCHHGLQMGESHMTSCDAEENKLRRKEGTMDRLERDENWGQSATRKAQQMKSDTPRRWPGQICYSATAWQIVAHSVHLSLCHSLRAEGCRHIWKHWWAWV